MQSVGGSFKPIFKWKWTIWSFFFFKKRKGAPFRSTSIYFSSDLFLLGLRSGLLTVLINTNIFLSQATKSASKSFINLNRDVPIYLIYSKINNYPVTFGVLNSVEHEDFCLLRCKSGYKARNLAMFIRNPLPSYLGLKTETTDFSENVVNLLIPVRICSVIWQNTVGLKNFPLESNDILFWNRRIHLW